MNQLKSPEKGYQSRIQTSTRRLYTWTGTWMAATVLMAFGLKFLWNKAMVFTLLAAGLNVGVGVGIILAYKNFLAEMDELLAMYDVIPFQADISHLAMLLSFTFGVAFLSCTRRYR